MGPRAGVDVLERKENFLHCRESSPDSSVSKSTALERHTLFLSSWFFFVFTSACYRQTSASALCWQMFPIYKMKWVTKFHTKCKTSIFCKIPSRIFPAEIAQSSFRSLLIRRLLILKKGVSAMKSDMGYVLCLPSAISTRLLMTTAGKVVCALGEVISPPLSFLQ